MKKTWKTTLVCAVALFMLVCCGWSPAVAGAASSAAGTALTAATALTVDVSVTERDASGEYDASEAVTLSPDGDLTITSAGTYILTGEYRGMIVIDAGGEDKVQLVLKNASIVNENGPAIYVRSADKVFLTAAEGSVNTVSDGADYTLVDDGTTVDAAVFSRDDLTINGSGELTIVGNFRHAVVSRDDLVITAGDLTVKAENVGLNGRDSVRLSGATVSITAGTDGIRSENGSEDGKGFVSAVDSMITIVSGRDGIQAETVFTAENAGIGITAGGGSSAGGFGAGGTGKGVKAGVSAVIDGGSYRIDASDDAVHTDGSLLIRDGDITLLSGDDGLHADEKAEISGGILDITACEGIEATVVLLSGGDISIRASDDGVNAAGKSLLCTPAVEITGGTLSVTMGAGDTDGVDSNGALVISGGTVSVNGQSAFDFDGSVTFSGGTVYVNGQQVSTISGQFMGGMGAFGGGPGGMGHFGNPGGMGSFGGNPGGRP